ncbi:MAG TPA: vanadium-dependent haloperoxidase [Steroidobacteraceae bacterium]|nr:vanadium-dependent haloperoxidase [Steroidobacteraceae bacterium]
MKRITGLLLCGLLAGAAGARADVVADPVVDWNQITVDAVTAGRPGPIGMVDIALVHIAVHDAVQAIEKRFEPYHFESRRASGKRSAAVAAAAHDVLVGMYPNQTATLDSIYFNYLADHGLGGDPGIAVGQQAALRILPLRRVNPDPLPPPFVGGTAVGQWRPTPSFLGNPPAPPPFAPMAVPWMGHLDPFTLTSPTRFRSEPPPALTSERYTRDFKEVKDLGSLTSTARSAEQTDLAYFYSGNIPAQWNGALRGVATRYLRRTGDSARLFALATMAAADALISSWDSKVHYVFWRPVTAIVEADNDGNPETIADASWQPLINTPNYPDYTSGANNVSGSMTRTLELFFGTDRVTFDVTTAVPNAVQKTRTYRRFSDAADDMVEARMLLGIHFRFADTAARTQGRRVADWAFNHYLLPLRR